MRQVIFDTETTGLNRNGPIAQGHRVIEIGCIELENRRLTGRHFHRYLNPERDVDVGAFNVHGLTDEFLANQPTFADIADEFWQYLQGVDELIAHNMPFDQTFLNQELQLMGDKRRLEREFALIDTLALAKQTFYAQKYNLDALCKRYGIDNSRRELHGALLDAELLAEVYLKLTGGQTDITFASPLDVNSNQQTSHSSRANNYWLSAKASGEEIELHQKIMDEISSQQ